MEKSQNPRKYVQRVRRRHTDILAEGANFVIPFGHQIHSGVSSPGVKTSSERSIGNPGLDGHKQDCSALCRLWCGVVAGSYTAKEEFAVKENACGKASYWPGHFVPVSNKSTQSAVCCGTERVVHLLFTKAIPDLGTTVGCRQLLPWMQCLDAF